MAEQATEWTGWITFASILLMFEGIMQAIYGLGALLNQRWYISTSSGLYLFDLNTWGWLSIILGAFLFLTGSLLLRGNLFGRTMGMLLVALGVVANAALIVVAPIWSMIAIVLYALVGYAILAHGHEMKQLTHS